MIQGHYLFNTRSDNRPPPLDMETLRAKLPGVGARFRKTPTLTIADHKPTPLPCEVIYVNRRRLWYTVEFEGRTGKFRESFKLPEQKG